MRRYARQMILPEVGTKGQVAFEGAHLLVVGAGGLAAPALQYLVGAGIGRITLVDGDVVSRSNLHRQTLFGEADEGRPKVSAAACRLRALNGACQIVECGEPLTPANAPALVRDATLVLDCADSFAVSYILSDCCLEHDRPLISASVLGFQGYVGGFCGGAPSLRAVFPDLPDRAASCATAGVLGPVVGMLGAAQAQMALGVLLEQSPSPLGQLMSVDMQNLRMSGFRFDGAPEPDADLRFLAAEAITEDDFVVELRGAQEAPEPITPHAARMDVDTFKTNAPRPRTGQRAIFACRSGLRAWAAASHLRTYWSGDIFLIAAGDG